jgi:hypothetical protein
MHHCKVLSFEHHGLITRGATQEHGPEAKPASGLSAFKGWQKLIEWCPALVVTWFHVIVVAR